MMLHGLQQRMNSLLSHQVVVSSHARLHATESPKFSPLDSLLLERLSRAEEALSAVKEKFTTAKFLHAGKTIELAEDIILLSLEEVLALSVPFVVPRNNKGKGNSTRPTTRPAPITTTPTPTPPSTSTTNESITEQLAAERELRTIFDHLVTARKRFKKTRPYANDEPKENTLAYKLLAECELCLEEAETLFGMAEWHMQKDSSMGNPAFILATVKAGNAALNSHQCIDALHQHLHITDGLSSLSFTSLLHSKILQSKTPQPFGVEDLHAAFANSACGSNRSLKPSSPSSPSSSSSPSSPSSPPSFALNANTSLLQQRNNLTQSSSPNSYSRASHVQHRSSRLMDPTPLLVSPVRGLVPALAERQRRSLVEEKRIREETQARDDGPDDCDVTMTVPTFTLGKQKDKQHLLKERQQREALQALEKVTLAAQSRLHMDADKAYADIQQRLDHEELKSRREKELKMERFKERENKRLKHIKEKQVKAKQLKIKRTWIQLKNKTLDTLRKKNNRMGQFKIAIKSKINRDLMVEEDQLSLLLREAEKLVLNASKEALEQVWYVIGPHQERLGGVGRSGRSGTTAVPTVPTVPRGNNGLGHTYQYNGPRRLLTVAVLHCTPSPLTGFASFHGDKSIHVPSRRHPMEIFFHKQLHAANNEGGNRRDQLTFVDYCCYANQFPTCSERRTAHAYLVVGDVCDVDTVLVENRSLMLFLSHLLHPRSCNDGDDGCSTGKSNRTNGKKIIVGAMGTGHHVLAEACFQEDARKRRQGSSAVSKQEKRKRINGGGWRVGPIEIVSANDVGTQRTVFCAHDQVLINVPEGYRATATGRSGWVAAMRNDQNVFSMGSFGFLGPASFRASVIRCRAECMESHRWTSQQLPKVPTMAQLSVNGHRAAARDMYQHLLHGGACEVGRSQNRRNDVVTIRTDDCAVVSCGHPRMPMMSMMEHQSSLQAGHGVVVGVTPALDQRLVVVSSPWLPNSIDITQHDRDVDISTVVQHQNHSRWSVNHETWLHRALGHDSLGGTVGRTGYNGRSTYSGRSSGKKNGQNTGSVTTTAVVNLGLGNDAEQKKQTDTEAVQTERESMLLHESRHFVASHTSSHLKKSVVRSVRGRWMKTNVGMTYVTSVSKDIDNKEPILTVQEHLQGLFSNGGKNVRKGQKIWIVPLHVDDEDVCRVDQQHGQHEPKDHVDRYTHWLHMLKKELSGCEYGNRNSLIIASYNSQLLQRIRRMGWWQIELIQLFTEQDSNRLAKTNRVGGFTASMKLYSSYLDGICVHEAAFGVGGNGGGHALVEAAHGHGLHVHVRLENVNSTTAGCSKTSTNNTNNNKQGSVVRLNNGALQKQKAITYLMTGIDGILTVGGTQHVVAAKHIIHQRAVEHLSQLQADQPKDVQKKQDKASNATPPSLASSPLSFSPISSRPRKQYNIKDIKTTQSRRHTFSPARPILRREYKHTAPSPRAKKGLSTRWTPRQDPVEYRRGIERIKSHTRRRATGTRFKSPTPTMTPAESFFQHGRQRIRTPKEKVIERQQNRKWLKRPPPKKNALQDVMLFFSTLSNSWAVSNKHDIRNMNMHGGGVG